MESERDYMERVALAQKGSIAKSYEKAGYPGLSEDPGMPSTPGPVSEAETLLNRTETIHDRIDEIERRLFGMAPQARRHGVRPSQQNSSASVGAADGQISIHQSANRSC